MNRIDFRGKNVLITGASTGIGQALSVEFARRGAHLALGAIPGENRILADHADQLRERYRIKTWLFAVDLLADKGPETLYRRVRSEVGEIFVLVNNAGTVAYGKFWETRWQGHSDSLRLNLYVPMSLMHFFLPDLLKQGEGLIINVSSVSALQPTPFQSVYGATKAGLQSLSQGIRAELKGTGVTVCTLNPPFIDTDLLKRDGYPPDLRFFSISGKRSTRWLARKALKAFERRKFIYVPGLWPAFIHLCLTRLSPRRLVDAVSGYFMQGRQAKRSNQ